LVVDLPACGLMPRGSNLPAEFFARPSDEVAPDLIGKILWRAGVGGGRLTEVEAYLPEGDPACHAARGRTPRNAAMFGPPGCVYLFQSYGMHVLLNVVCERESVGSAVLIRSFEPMGDTTRLRINRAAGRRGQRGAANAGANEADEDRGLSCGPGRVGQALALHLGLNGLGLGEASGLFILDDGERPEVRQTTRVGISHGARMPLRYYMAGTGYVSGLARMIGGEGT
jgi:DNA-3-methyladenine glycosylase